MLRCWNAACQGPHLPHKSQPPYLRAGRPADMVKRPECAKDGQKTCTVNGSGTVPLDRWKGRVITG